jgi:hypothetical protein
MSECISSLENLLNTCRKVRNRSILMKSRHIGFGVFIVHLSMATYILRRRLDPALWAECFGVGHILLTVGHGVVAQHSNRTLRHQVATHHNIVLQLPAQHHKNRVELQTTYSSLLDMVWWHSTAIEPLGTRYPPTTTSSSSCLHNSTTTGLNYRLLNNKIC